MLRAALLLVDTAENKLYNAEIIFSIIELYNGGVLELFCCPCPRERQPLVSFSGGQLLLGAEGGGALRSPPAAQSL